MGKVAFLSGGLFAVGLAIAGMTQPARVQGFLDVTGAWDPTLAFVMGGAVLINIVLFTLILRLDRPALERVFDLPGTSKIDRPLVLGSALFGVGWGLAGYCPGPGLTSLGTLDVNVLVFVATMIVGMAAHAWLTRKPAPVSA